MTTALSKPSALGPRPSTPSRRNFVVLWMISAAVLTAVRSTNPADMTVDLAYQIQAAQHLLAGQGLATYRGATLIDLAQPLQLATLTWFPCGYSVVMALLLWMGASTALAVKSVAAGATLLGWWGWARVAFACMGEGLSKGRWWRWTAYITALTTPLFYTVPWNGTDVLLWACVPWVTQWLTESSGHPDGERPRLDLLAGALSGVALLMRYASLSLVGYSILLLAWQSGSRPRQLVRRTIAFACGLLPLLFIQVYVNNFVADESRPFGPVTLSNPLTDSISQVARTTRLLSSANFSAAFWLPPRLLDHVTKPIDQAPWVLVLTVFVLTSAAFLGWKFRHTLQSAASDLRVTTAGFLAVVPLFLWASSVFGGYTFVNDPRLYAPLIPITVLAAFALAVPRSGETRPIRIVTAGSSFYVAGYLTVSLLGVALVATPTGKGAQFRDKITAKVSLKSWPFQGLLMDLSPARIEAIRLARQEPRTVLLTSRPHWFAAEPAVDRAHLQWIEFCSRFKFATGPFRVLIITEDHGLPDELLWANRDGELRPADCIARVLNPHLVRRFPDESVKILEAHVPAGHRVTFEK